MAQDIKAFELMQETAALLKILALGTSQIEKRNIQSATEIIQRIRQRLYQTLQGE